jgi:hypothetical protein
MAMPCPSEADPSFHRGWHLAESRMAAATFSALSASSFNAALWNTVSSTGSRAKSSFGW